tara:strand:+ start:588 stop:857 length:270 start_codon:yes stop_codon:yes gene_type:complete
MNEIKEIEKDNLRNFRSTVINLKPIETVKLESHGYFISAKNTLISRYLVEIIIPIIFSFISIYFLSEQLYYTKLDPTNAESSIQQIHSK